jgi:hypothetical protein
LKILASKFLSNSFKNLRPDISSKIRFVYYHYYAFSISFSFLISFSYF